jgi:hypothetical protein
LASAAEPGEQRADASRVRNTEMERQRGMCGERYTFSGNATTMV